MTRIRGVLNACYLKISKAETWDTVSAIAEEHFYSPACDYLKHCHNIWDAQPHIDDLFDSLILDVKYTQDIDLCKVLLQKWLVSAVLMAFNVGDTAAQGVLILVGPQGIGKTRFLYKLLPNTDWGADGITLDPRNKDDALRVMRFWIVELGEIGNTIKREKLDAIKQYITQKQDAIRKPYARSTIILPRTTVFLGTVNEIFGDGFLRDLTGNRRYWPIAVAQILDKPIDRDQLWGYVMHLAFDCKMPHYLTIEEQKKLEEINEQHVLQSAEEKLLIDTLDWNAPIEQWRNVTATDLCQENNISPQNNRKIGRALQNLAKQDIRIKVPKNHHERKYLVPPKMSNET
jgi:predicted P-loop ATPase